MNEDGKLINEDEFRIEDIGPYENGVDESQVAGLSFGRVTFTDSGSTNTANVDVPYTGEET